MLLFCCINLVKFEKIWLSKILEMTYNLERREYPIIRCGTYIFMDQRTCTGMWQLKLLMSVYITHTCENYFWSIIQPIMQCNEYYDGKMASLYLCFLCIFSTVKIFTQTVKSLKEIFYTFSFRLSELSKLLFARPSKEASYQHLSWIGTPWE